MAKEKKTAVVAVPGYDSVLSDVVALLESSRRAAARSVNSVMTSTYWLIGRRIVEEEQGGRRRGEYGAAIVERLAQDLTRRFGRGFGRRNLFQMRAFYVEYREIVQGPSAQLAPRRSSKKVQALHAQLTEGSAPRFPLPWTHYVLLLSVDRPGARSFYETEALRGGWTSRQLQRQIGTQFYERTMLSRNKVAMLTKGTRPRTDDAVTAEEELKDPFVLEFLDLKDEYSESALEAALIAQLETFLLELGGDFAFVGRQRRLRVGDTWYRIDLLFFHRRLKCLVIIDLKIGKFTHADAGQMHLYLNYAREHWMLKDEHPPVGLILCTKKNDAVVHYSLDGSINKVLAAEYRTTLPDEEVLADQVRKTLKLLEGRNRAP